MNGKKVFIGKRPGAHSRAFKDINHALLQIIRIRLDIPLLAKHINRLGIACNPRESRFDQVGLRIGARFDPDQNQVGRPVLF
jgi:hypothetical protein